MNALVGDLGLSSWKAIVAALVLPPAPLLLLALIAASLLWARRRAGWWLMTASLVGLWFGCCVVTGDALDAWLLRPPPALGAARIEALRHEARTRQDVAIIVLGAGREIMAPEYGFGSLSAEAIERLRYGAWLAHRTGIPLGFSGGTSYANGSGPSEAQIAARIAAEEFARPLRWREDAARDTRENAARSLALLREDGIRKVVLVTHGWHMPRARRAFEEAARGRFEIIAAPMGLAPRIERPLLRWLPSSQGYLYVHRVLHEALGLLAGS
jgi:uncharacterized SAM-binding protein YcdF (DUF218 family)